MPGLFVALALFATLAFTGAHAKKLTERLTLAPGKRWLLTATFIQAPQQARFNEILRANFNGIESIRWVDPTKVELVVNSPVPVTIDVGAPGPGGLFMFASAVEAPPAPALPAVSGTPPRAWHASLETHSSVLDKPSFEDVLESRLRGRVVRIHWVDSRHLGVVFLSRRDPRSAVGLTKPIRGIRTTITSVTKVPT